MVVTGGSAVAEQLVIKLRDGRTIVLDTAEIASLEFVQPGQSVRLVPSPKRFSGASRPPGEVSVNFHPVQLRRGNLRYSITMTNVLPNHRYNAFLFVNGRRVPDRILCSTITDPGGCAHFEGIVQLPPGDCTLALSISEQNSEKDIYVTPGIYQNAGTRIQIPPPGQGPGPGFRPGGPGRPRR